MVLHLIFIIKDYIIYEFVFRLAKSIASQIRERLNRSHEAFAAALKQLEARHTGRLDRIEEQRLKMRKVHAPRVAKLALESTSLRDTILYGMKRMTHYKIKQLKYVASISIYKGKRKVDKFDFVFILSVDCFGV